MYKKNDIIKLKIVETGSSGEGIAKEDGFVFFVKDVVAGDEIEAKVMKVNKSYGYARLMKVICPSKDRVEPACPVANKCGGCQLLNMSYEAQLRFKENKVKNNLERIGKATDFKYNPIVGMPEKTGVFRYRNKTQFPVGKNKEGEIVYGFFASRTHSVIEIEDCLATPEVNIAILEAIKGFMTDFNVLPYDEKTHTGLVRHVLIRNGFATKELVVCLVINGKIVKNFEVLTDRIKEAIERYNDKKIEGCNGRNGEFVAFENNDIKSKNFEDCNKSAEERNWKLAGVVLNENREKTNVIMGKKCRTIFGRDYVVDKIGNLEFEISPLSFYQVNPVQTEKMYEKALEYAALSGNENVWDLYCGIGTISLFLAKGAKKVFGVEIVPQAIEDAKKNAKNNGIENAEFICGAAEDVIPEHYKETCERPDVVVVDPPRKGCDERLLETIVRSGTKRIVYVSCDSATLARDVKYLEENGYRLREATAFDNFPGTEHVESVCLLSRVSNRKPDAQIKLTLNMEDYYRIKDAKGGESDE